MWPPSTGSPALGGAPNSPTAAISLATVLLRHGKQRFDQPMVAVGQSLVQMVAERPQTSAMTVQQERAYIAETLSRLAACGVETAGWFGADYAESTVTPQLLGEAGVAYVSDWANDEQPYAMQTPGNLVATPLWADFDDQTVLINRMCNLDMFEDHFIKALDQLNRDAQASARLLHFCVRPWVMGAPLRIAAFERILDHALRLPQTWTPRLGEVVQAWRASAQAR